MNLIITFFKDYIVIINIFFLITIVLLERKKPVYTLFWITILILAPYIGFIFYLFFGLSFRKKRVVDKFYKWKFLHSKKVISSSERKDLNRWKQLISYLEIASNNKLTTLNAFKLFTDGNVFFNHMIEDLNEAKHSINMEYYIFRYDELGKRIIDILIEKAKNGVEVNVIIDEAGGADRKMIKLMKDNNINVEIFFPSPFASFKIANLRANYRDHRKLCLIDSKLGYIGGFNIGLEYLSKGKLGHWRDTGVRVFGEAVLELEKEFFFSWGIAKKKPVVYQAKEYAFEHEAFQEIIRTRGKYSGYSQVVSSGPNYQFKTMRDTFLKIILEAKKYIYIQTPYFVPDDTILEALKIAALSGVKIKIMIPDKPDHFFIYWVNQYFVGELLDLGVTVYRYHKGFLHSKMVLADDEVVSIGTANFDNRSFYQNFEININIYEKDIAEKFREIFYDDMKTSSKLLRSEYSKRGFYIKSKESICRLLAPIL